MTYGFGNCQVDATAFEVRRAGERVRFEPQVLDLLLFLIENRERIVTRDEIVEKVWKGRAVSDAAISSRIKAARQLVGDTGKGQKIIRTIHGRGFRFVAHVEVSGEGLSESPPHNGAGFRYPGAASDAPESDAATIDPAPALPDKPSIAVLPFDNLSGDAEQDYFADGVVEEIITALSRFGDLFVIARNSSFTYKGKPVDVRRAGRELGVRYVLEGSVRKAAHQVRIVGQLIDASTGAHLWADRFDGEIEDIFHLQDQVTERVVGAIAPTLEKAEIDRVKRMRTESLGAYDLYLRGMASVHLATRQANDEALRHFYDAIELDPDFASAYAMAAWCHTWRKSNGWVEDRPAEIHETERLARRAAQLGENHAVALAMSGHALAYVVGEVEDGAAIADRALVLNPNLASAWMLSGWITMYLGKPEEAIAKISHAMRLSPLDPFRFMTSTYIGFCHFLLGQYDEASSWAEAGFRERPNWSLAARVVAASHAMAGRTEQAKNAGSRLLEIDPTFRVSQLKDLVVLRRPEHLAGYEEGLRKAGLPE